MYACKLTIIANFLQCAFCVKIFLSGVQSISATFANFTDKLCLRSQLCFITRNITMKRINESFVELNEENLSSFISSKVNACDREVKYTLCPNKTRKASCRWQTRATLANSLHGLRKSSGVVSCIASLSIDSVPMVSYYVLYSNCVCKMRHFGDTRLLKLPWPWNPAQGLLKVIESDTIR